MACGLTVSALSVALLGQISGEGWSDAQVVEALSYLDELPTISSQLNWLLISTDGALAAAQESIEGFILGNDASTYNLVDPTWGTWQGWQEWRIKFESLYNATTAIAADVADYLPELDGAGGVSGTWQYQLNELSAIKTNTTYLALLYTEMLNQTSLLNQQILSLASINAAISNDTTQIRNALTTTNSRLLTISNQLDILSSINASLADLVGMYGDLNGDYLQRTAEGVEALLLYVSTDLVPELDAMMQPIEDSIAIVEGMLTLYQPLIYSEAYNGRLALEAILSQLQTTLPAGYTDYSMAVPEPVAQDGVYWEIVGQEAGLDVGVGADPYVMPVGLQVGAVDAAPVWNMAFDISGLGAAFGVSLPALDTISVVLDWGFFETTGLRAFCWTVLLVGMGWWAALRVFEETRRQ